MATKQTERMEIIGETSGYEPGGFRRFSSTEIFNRAKHGAHGARRSRQSQHERFQPAGSDAQRASARRPMRIITPR